jgi:spore germination cell wall hydrolase CwlJ-like protein
MFRFTRAAAFAAASLAVTFSTAFATPSHAMDLASAPVAAHHLANLAADQQLADKVEVLATVQTDFSSPAPIPVLPPKSRSLVDLVDAHDDVARVRDTEQECLAGAIYFESKGEPLEGQLAVAEVVINRAQSGKYPKTLCGVIKQRHQFSFIRAGQFPPIQRSTAAWRKAVAIAHIALQDLADSRAAKAMFFHAKYVSPRWRGLTRIAAVGNHIFYR